MFFLHKKHLTQRNLYTQTAHRDFCRPTFLHAETSPRAVFTQQKIFRTETFTHKKKNMHSSFCRQTVFSRKFSAQKSYAQKLLHTTFFTYRRFYTDVFTQTQIAHRNLCTQHAFTHNQFLHREALLPLLVRVPPRLQCAGENGYKGPMNRYAHTFAYAEPGILLFRWLSLMLHPLKLEASPKCLGR